MSDRTYSETPRLLLENLPAYFDSAPLSRNAPTHAVLESVGNELARLQATAERVRNNSFPQRADDEFGFLAYWEAVFELPGASGATPPTLEERRERVLAEFRSRKSSTGEEWEERLDDIIGGSHSYEELADEYRVNVTVPYGPGSGAFGVIVRQLRKITPAHLEVTIESALGFIVGESAVGDVI